MTKKKYKATEIIDILDHTRDSDNTGTYDINNPDTMQHTKADQLKDDRVEELLGLVDDSAKTFYINPNFPDVKLRVLSWEETLYIDELYYSYAEDVGITKLPENLQLAYNLHNRTCISICMAGTPTPISRGTPLSVISKKSILPLASVKALPPSYVNTLLQLLNAQEQKLNPTLETLSREEVDSYVEAIKKSQIKLKDLSYQTMHSILDNLILQSVLEDK